MNNPHLVNPHLDGGPFLWEAGDTGILLLHGYTATSAEVRPLARVLHQHGYTVSGPLLPGHGTKPTDLNRTRWQEWTAAAEACYQDLARRCRRVIVGGESMGGLLALYVAAHHPEAAAVLSYSTALKLPPRPVLRLVPALKYVIASQPKPKNAPTAADARWQGYPVNPISALNELMRLQKEVAGLLPRIHQPTLVMQGRLDRSVSPLAADLIFKGVSSQVKEMHWMERSTHCILLDQEYQQAAQITLSFLKRL